MGFRPRRIRSRLRALLVVGLAATGRPSAASLLVGAGGLLGATILHAWASGHLAKRVRLATGGPYRWSRNPIYLAQALQDASLVIGAAGWPPALVPPILGVVYLGLWGAYVRHRVRSREEPDLAERFAPAWPAYRDAVPRWIPRLSPAPADEVGEPPRSFDPGLLRESRALLRQAGHQAVLAAFCGVAWLRGLRLPPLAIVAAPLALAGLLAGLHGLLPSTEQGRG